jgi:hypothetical protein
MADDNDNDFEFDDEDLSDEENEEIHRQHREEKKRLRNHPLNLQAREIMQMVDVLLDTCSDEAIRERYGSTMQESCMIITAKLASGLMSDSYVICMQKAAIIRDHAEYLRLSNHMLNTLGAFDKKYVAAFREEMEKFRGLFIEWASEIRGMDNDFADEWGLFVK